MIDEMNHDQSLPLALCILQELRVRLRYNST